MSRILVIHPQDPSTEFLKYSYEGMGYDVVRDGNIDRMKLRQLIKDHDKIIMMGHGVPSGLFNTCGGKYPYVIDSSFVDLLKEKETASIWCWSDDFFKNNHIGKGELHTGVIISEVAEQKMIFGKVFLNNKQMLDNMIWFASILKKCLTMDPYDAVEYMKKNYNSSDPVSQYNRDHFIVL